MTFANFVHPASAKIRRNGNESTFRRYLATQKEKKGVLIPTHAQNVLTATHTHVLTAHKNIAHIAQASHNVVCQQHTHISDIVANAHIAQNFTNLTL